MSEHSSLSTNARAPLQRALQQVVIPALFRRQTLSVTTSVPGTLSEQDRLRLAQASVHSSYAIEVELEALMANGWSITQVYLQAVAETARLLGQWWVNDELDFANLTLAVGRLQDIVREWESRFLRSAAPIPGADQFDVLLLSEFNDQHSLGMLMLQSFFKRDGWRVHNTWGMSDTALLERVQHHRFHLLGLSICTDRHLAQTRRLIRAVRQQSFNPNISIMVGGPFVMSHPEMAEDLGADWLSGHADQASLEAFEKVSVLQPTAQTA